MEEKDISDYAVDYFNDMDDPYGSYLEITGAYEAGAAKQEEFSAKEAINFAKWVHENRAIEVYRLYGHQDKKYFWDMYYSNDEEKIANNEAGEWFTIEELYELYKQAGEGDTGQG